MPTLTSTYAVHQHLPAHITVNAND